MPCVYDFNWIIPNKLILGGTADNIMTSEFLKNNNVVAVVCVRKELSWNLHDLKKNKINFLQVSIDDDDDVNIKKHFIEAYHFIDKNIQKGAVLIHCYAGISRSTTIMASYLMRKLKINASQALTLIKEQRSCINPNPGFKRQLRIWEKALKNCGVIE